MKVGDKQSGKVREGTKGRRSRERDEGEEVEDLSNASRSLGAALMDDPKGYVETRTCLDILQDDKRAVDTADSTVVCRECDPKNKNNKTRQSEAQCSSTGHLFLLFLLVLILVIRSRHTEDMRPDMKLAHTRKHAR